MEKIVIRGPAIGWVKSYLSNREQIVFSNGEQSIPLSTNIGLPQGTLLSPTLFLIMNNDLPNIAPDRTLPILHADDSNFIANSEYSQRIALKMNKWSRQNGLRLNNEKSQIIHFEHKNKPLDYSILIRSGNGNTIQQTDSTKFLGVHLDCKLSWVAHTESLRKTINSLSYLFRKLRLHVRDYSTLLMLYYGQCYSKLSYGVICWGNSQNIESVLITHKSIILQIARVPRRHSCKKLFIKYDISTVISICILACAVYVKSRINNYKTHENVHNYNTRGKNKLCTPQYRLSSAMDDPHAMSIEIFNNLPS
ncbi:hypothetical protein JTB14_015803 [Gonioctena quinquepunctata]|nr:hypothetical protein JTB14_015803 [Gonioctena quinquepunctata]